LLEQNYNVSETNKHWVSDITFIAIDQGWLYLAVIMDLFSRAIVGWAMDKHIDTDLISSALNMAKANRALIKG